MLAVVFCRAQRVRQTVEVAFWWSWVVEAIRSIGWSRTFPCYLETTLISSRATFTHTQLIFHSHDIRLLLWNVDAPKNIEAGDRERWVIPPDQTSAIAREYTPLIQRVESDSKNDVGLYQAQDSCISVAYYDAAI